MPLEIQISYAGRLAISGKVLQIQLFNPSVSEVKLTSTVPGIWENASGQRRLSAATIEKCPETPFLGSSYSPVTGVVILNGLVTTQGKVRDIFTIGSSNPLLTTSAVEAFGKCTLKPFLLDGQPAENPVVFETISTINGGASGQGFTVVGGGPHSVPSPH